MMSRRRVLGGGLFKIHWEWNILLALPYLQIFNLTVPRPEYACRLYSINCMEQHTQERQIWAISDNILSTNWCFSPTKMISGFSIIKSSLHMVLYSISCIRRMHWARPRFNCSKIGPVLTLSYVLNNTACLQSIDWVSITLICYQPYLIHWKQSSLPKDE